MVKYLLYTCSAFLYMYTTTSLEHYFWGPCQISVLAIQTMLHRE